MASVTKTGQARLVQSTLSFRIVEIILQHYPGITGSDADRAIASIPYKLYHDGKLFKTNNAQSAGDGSLYIFIPSGVKVELEVFGSRYEIVMLDALEDPTTIKGYQRRLTILGYPIGGIDALVGANTDAQVLNFQGDAGIDTFGPDATTGVIDANSKGKLKTAIGE